jgi:peptidyl-prolyl cis-trans isomerase C
MSTLKPKKILLTMMVLAVAGLSACQPVSPTSTTPPTASPTSMPPTETQVPMAILVNGSGITQVEFEAELARFQAAQTELGNSVPLEEATQRVQDDLVNQVLLEQGAQAGGFVLDDAQLQARIDSLVTKIGGAQVLTSWEEQNGYTDETLKVALRRQIAGAWMRDQIISAVPNTAEQVHVQQILLYTAEKAQAVWDELNSGADFASLAAEYDPVTKGELGWFPRNYLPDVQVEEAAFALQPGQYSNVVQTIAGYSIMFVVAREPDHILSPDALLTLQNLALNNWLKDKRENSTITLAP